jgi:hypothetical protein
MSWKSKTGIGTRDTPVHLRAMAKQPDEERRLTASPAVGIFFVYENRLLIEGTPVEVAQPYGDFMGHAKGHPAFWADLQGGGTVPTDVEYDEVARGRVGFSVKEQMFQVFMDSCIMKNEDIVGQIARYLNLPPEARVSPRLDSHYTCPSCNKSRSQREQEETDWEF